MPPLRALLLCLLLLLFMASHAQTSSLDLSKALVIGNGPKAVIEFTDPDCSFCRKSARYFKSRTDVTKYVFFVPLDRHPEAKNKIRYILSHNNAVNAYYDIMAGKFDHIDATTLSVNQRGNKLQKIHQELAKKVGVQATPTYMIYGRVVEGFDLPEIEALLGK